MIHTDKTDARIRKAYENEERISDVARELGCTRNVVIGRANRLGLSQTGRSHHSPFSATKDNGNYGRQVREAIRASDPERAALWRRNISEAQKRAWELLTDTEKAARLAKLNEARVKRTVHQNGAPVKELERT